MNKKFHIFFFVLSALLFYLQAEQTEYFINPKNFYAPFIAVGRSADIHKYEYSCYIRNDFHNKVDEPEIQLCTTWERFFSSLEDYLRPSRVEVRWNFKLNGIDDKEKHIKTDNMDDGRYEIHLIEANKRNVNLKNDYVYFINLDTQPPDIKNEDCNISKWTLYKNKKEDFSFSLKSTAKANVWRVLLNDDRDVPLYQKEFAYGEEQSFPPYIYIPYTAYRKLPLGRHEISVTARDSAGNEAKAAATFILAEHPFNFSIFSNEGLIYEKNDEVKPFYYVGFGIQSRFWRTSICDESGVEHFYDEFHADEDGFCKRFEWNGVSQTTHRKVPEGRYSVFLSCRDDTGKEIEQIAKFFVSSEQNGTVSNTNDEAYVEAAYLSGVFSGDTFQLRLINYKKPVQDAVLKVLYKERKLYEAIVDDAKNMTWDGYDETGTFALSTGEEYTFILETNDGIDETQTFSTNVRSGLICIAESDTRKRVVVAPIYFEANDAEVFSINQYFNENAASLRKSTEAVLKQLGQNDFVIIEGHANYTTYPNRRLMNSEKAELFALSQNRADIIKRVFMLYGIPENRIRIHGNGGEHFLVKPNAKDSWKNRRVELFIEREE